MVDLLFMLRHIVSHRQMLFKRWARRKSALAVSMSPVLSPFWEGGFLGFSFLSIFVHGRMGLRGTKSGLKCIDGLVQRFNAAVLCLIITQPSNFELHCVPR